MKKPILIICCVFILLSLLSHIFSVKPLQAQTSYTTNIVRNNTSSESSFDVEILSLYSVNNAQCGRISRLWVQLKNIGATALPETAYAWYYVDGPDWLGSHFVGYTWVGDLASNTSQWYFYDWDIPVKVTAGSYNYWVRVYGDEGSALSGWKGPQSFAISCDHSVSAEIISLSPVNYAQCGHTSTLWAWVMNSGTAALPDTTNLWFYVDGPDWSGSHWVGYAYTGGLAVGSGEWCYYRWNIPSEASPGTYFYWGRVYQDDGTAISDWKGPQSFNVNAKGFLSAKIVSNNPIANAHPGDTVTFRVQIQNDGSSSFPTETTVWFWVDGPSWDGNHWVGQDSASDLEPGAEKACSIAWDIPANAATGTYHYWAQVWIGSQAAISDWSEREDFAVIGDVSAWKLIALGDSITYGINHDNPNEEGYVPKLSRLLNNEVINLGMPGCGIDFLTSHLIENLKTYHPTHVLILIGTNDVETYSFDIQHYSQSFQWMIQTIRDYDAIPYVGTLTPLCRIPDVEEFQENRDTANEAIYQQIQQKMGVSIADFAAAFDCSLIEKSDERHHPNSEGYALMANMWYEALTTK